jgi:hypothetical protein
MGVQAELWLPEQEQIKLRSIRKEKGMTAYLLPKGTSWSEVLRFT